MSDDKVRKKTLQFWREVQYVFQDLIEDFQIYFYSHIQHIELDNNRMNSCSSMQFDSVILEEH